MGSCKTAKQARVAYRFACRAYIMNLITDEQLFYLENQCIEY